MGLHDKPVDCLGFVSQPAIFFPALPRCYKLVFWLSRRRNSDSPETSLRVYCRRRDVRAGSQFIVPNFCSLTGSI